MSVTIEDVARAAGVSLSTVSRALADSPRVKVETRLRIQQLARDMGYIPSAIARGLATKRTHNLGVVVRNIADHFIGELVRCIDHVALEHAYTLILSHCGDDPQRELAAIDILRQQRVDAIVVADPSVAEPFLPMMEEMGIPVILINRPEYRLSVSTDNIAAARLAVNHLVDLGHERIAYIGSSANPGESGQRRVGYEHALRARGIPLDSELVLEGMGDWSVAGRECMKQLLRLPRPPTAVFAFNDLTAIGAIGAVHRIGLSVPVDLSVVGFDDISLDDHVVPPLTTVAQDKVQMARISVEIALSQLEGHGPMPRRVLPGRLVLRGSTRYASGLLSHL